MFSLPVGFILGRLCHTWIIKVFGFGILGISESLINTDISCEVCAMKLITNNKKSKSVNDIHVSYK